MPSIEITDTQRDRITALREELADAHAGTYTSVTLPDTVAYLLDLAEVVEDPDRIAEIKQDQPTPGDISTFPRAQLAAQLRERNRRHSDPDSESPMDLSTIAGEYHIEGRSNMTKDELITAIVDSFERRYTAPFAHVDISVPDPAVDTQSDTDDVAGNGSVHDDETDSDTNDDSDGSQLDVMLSLLDTYSDKWQSADGDARYEVELPDGSIETARTKDDVRAILFKQY
jgi:hypothetical protein